MTVRNFKKILEGLDDNTEVLMSKDSEGNSYSPLSGYDCGYIDKNDIESYYIESYFSERYNFRDNGFKNEEEWQEYKKKAMKVIVLYPVN
jgi:hypothetical protein